MIRIYRQDEPDWLKLLRARELTRVRAIANPSVEDLGTYYREVAAILWHQQHCKCCYCERSIEVSFYDVEHFRPKARANRQPGSAQTYGYWWLTWTWENLLFACPSCNRSNKKDLFPLAPGSFALKPEESPPGLENPLLIDPAEEDPIDEIQFVELETGRFAPAARAAHERGAITVHCLGLRRDDLLELYAKHVRNLEPKIAEMLESIQGGERADVERSWQRLGRELRPWCQFLALTYDVIDQRIPEPIRQQWGLDLPRPQLTSG